MHTSVALSLCLLLALISYSSSSTSGTATPPYQDSGDLQTLVHIDCIEFIHFDNIAYLQNATVSESTMLQQQLGSEHAVVTINVAQTSLS